MAVKNTSEIWKQLDKRVKSTPMPGDNARRFQRAVSWGKLSCKLSEDLQMEFVCLWMALDALIGQAADVHAKKADQAGSNSGRLTRKQFWQDVLAADKDGKIAQARDRCKKEISELVRLRYAYTGFWNAMYDAGVREKWEKNFSHSIRNFDKYEKASWLVDEAWLELVHSRLSVVRNQIMHGAMTHGTLVGKTQVRYGVKILRDFVPCIASAMASSSRDWGDIPYPPIEKKSDGKDSDPPIRFK